MNGLEDINVAEAQKLDAAEAEFSFTLKIFKELNGGSLIPPDKNSPPALHRAFADFREAAEYFEAAIDEYISRR